MRTVTIEQLAKWAVTEELPKSRIPFWHETPDQYGNGSAKAFGLGSQIDRSVSRPGLVNEFGVVAFDLPTEPHADARAFFDVIAEIEADPDVWLDPDDVPHEIKALTVTAHPQVEGAMNLLLPLLDGFLSLARERETCISAERGMWPRRGCWGLVQHMAITRSLDLVGDPCDLDYERGRSGLAKWFVRDQRDVAGVIITMEVSGYDEKRKRVKEGAYHKVTLEPDPTPVFGARMDWVIWRAILAGAAARLEGRLIDHRLITSANDDLPWSPGFQRPRIWVQRDEARVVASDRKKKKRLSS